MSRAVFAIALVLAACSSDEKLTLGAMAGIWDATEARYVAYADRSNTDDWFGQPGGYGLSMDIRADGRLITREVYESGTSVVVDTATIVLSGNVVDIVEYSPSMYRVSLNGDRMTWVGLDTVQVQFSGSLEAAFQEITMQRR